MVLFSTHHYTHLQEAQTMWQQVCENLDRLASVRLRPLDKIQDNVQMTLYDLARNGGGPISFTVASRLHDMKGCRVAVVTGTYDPVYLPGGETDGPVGAAVLARALHALGYETSILIDETIVGPMARLARHAGFPGEIRPLSVENQDENTAMAEDYDAAVYIEKLGSNIHGIQHSANGLSCDGNDAKVDGFAARMLERKAFTAGLGDGGNEVGFGLLYDKVQELVPHGRECRCPCKGGIATPASASVVFPAGTSNWAAYAVVGGLACLSERPALVHTPCMEEGLLHLAATLGCNDGATGTSIPYLDGVPTSGAAAVVELMQQAVQQSFLSWGDRPF